MGTGTMNLYEIYLRRKENGEKLNFNNVSHKELQELARCVSASMIAKLYNVSAFTVVKKYFRLY